MGIPKIRTGRPAHWRKGEETRPASLEGGSQITAEKFDVYSHVTNQIIAQIEAGTPPWRKPWTGGGAVVGFAQVSAYVMSQDDTRAPFAYYPDRQSIARSQASDAC